MARRFPQAAEIGLEKLSAGARGLRQLEFDHDGRRRSCFVYLPPTSEAPPSGWPLVLQLHGRGIDPVRFDRMTGFSGYARDKGFAVLMPAAVGEAWNDGLSFDTSVTERPNDVAFLRSLLERALDDPGFDRARLYAVGMSNGAGMIARLICEGDSPLAAVAQVAATAPAGAIRQCRPGPLPLVQIHGTADPYWPYEGGIAAGLRRRLVGGGLRRPVLSVDEWADFLAETNEAFGPAKEVVSETVGLRRWYGRTDKNEAVSRSDLAFYRIDGGGHTWPGARLPLPALLFGRTERDFDATAAIWQFFAAHPSGASRPATGGSPRSGSVQRRS